jgi:UDP-N-acetylmuramyl pentapeptide synthase
MIVYQTLQHFFPDRKISTSPKNFNGELGLSLSVFEITEREPTLHCFFTTFWVCFFRCFFGKKRYEVIVLEYGIDTPGEMDFILKVAHPDIGIFTAIDAVHSEQFGSPADIANEESKMVLHTKELVFLNRDDTSAMQLFSRIQVDKLTYQTQGYESEADISFKKGRFVLGAEKHEIQSAFSFSLKGKEYQVTTNLIGKANYGYLGVALAIVETLAYQMGWTVCG